MNYTSLFYICWLSLLWEAKAARILCFFASPMRSHLIIHGAIADTLAEAGHTVTMISNEPAQKYCPKCHHIDLPNGGFENNYVSTLIKNASSLYKRVEFMVNNIVAVGNGTLQEPLMKEFLNNHKAGDYDLLIIGYFVNDFVFGLGAHFQCPVIVSFMTQPYYPILRFMGNPTEPAYVPVPWFNIKQQPMYFFDRVKNLILSWFERFLIYPLMVRKWQEAYEFNFPPDRYPPMSEAYSNISLTFVNYFSLADGPIRSMVPALIEIGGIQIKEQLQPLDNELINILNASEGGVIYFSMGSNVHSSHFPTEAAKIIFKVLSELPYTVLMKWNENATDLLPKAAKNIVIKSWFPQSDLLAHPKIKLFITHCGWGSVVEAVYYGVPMLAIPLFSDQHQNAANIHHKGLGLRLNIKDLSMDSLHSGIMEVLKNPLYKTRAIRFSQLYRDRLTTPRQLVTYWVDYVLRYQGAKHLQSPAVFLTWWQLESLDVYGFLLTILLAISILFVFGCKYLYRRFYSKKRKSNSNTRKSSKRKTH